MKLYIINGEAGVGKDTFIHFIVRNCNLNIMNLHRSDLAKRALYSIGWDGVKTPEVRNALAAMTTLTHSWGASQELIHKAENEADVIFFHARDPKSIEELKEEFPFAETILIENPRVVQQEKDSWDIKNYTYDHTIMNNSTLEVLEFLAKSFICNTIMKEENR